MNAADDTVSVVVPLYNKAATIGRLLTSIRAQTHRPIETIVVDDGSTDGGAGVVRGWADPTVRLVQQANRGPGAARNAGLARAEGGFVAFVDGDDELDPAFLATALAAFHDAPELSMVAMGYANGPSDPAARARGELRLDGIYALDAQSPVELVDRLETFVSLQFALIRTDVAKQRGGYFDLNRCLLGEDAFFTVKLLFNDRIRIVPTELGIYHRDASGLHGQGFAEMPAMHPFFSHYPMLAAAVPADRRPLLEAFITERAVRAAVMYAKLGDRRAARWLLSSFPGGGSTAHRARVLAELAPLLPTARRAARAVRALARRAPAVG